MTTQSRFSVHSHGILGMPGWLTPPAGEQRNAMLAAAEALNHDVNWTLMLDWCAHHAMDPMDLRPGLMTALAQAKAFDGLRVFPHGAPAWMNVETIRRLAAFLQRLDHNYRRRSVLRGVRDRLGPEFAADFAAWTRELHRG